LLIIVVSNTGGGLGDCSFHDDDESSLPSLADPLLDDYFWGGEERAEIPSEWSDEFKLEDDVTQDVNGLGDNLGIFWRSEAFDGYQEAPSNAIADGHAPEASSSTSSSSSSASSTAYSAPEMGNEDLITGSVDLPMSNGAWEEVLQIPDDDDAAEPVRSRPKRNRASINVDDMEKQYLTWRGGKRAKGTDDYSEQDAVDEIWCGGDSKEEELCTQCALPASQHPRKRSYVVNAHQLSPRETDLNCFTVSSDYAGITEDLQSPLSSLTRSRQVSAFGPSWCVAGCTEFSSHVMLISNPSHRGVP
jgi:hypothetical protein